MSKLQPTQIVDKNGKATTVHKKTEDAASRPERVKNLPVPSVVNVSELTPGAGNSKYADDPHNTHYEFSRRLTGHIAGAQQLIDLAPDDESRKELLDGYIDINRQWAFVDKDGESLQDVSDRMGAFFESERKRFEDGHKNMAFNISLREFSKVQPIAEGEEYIPRRGRTDISEEEKRKIASLTDVGGWAMRNMGITLGDDSEPVEFDGYSLVSTAQWILNYRQREVEPKVIGALITEFLDPDFDGNLDQALGEKHFTVPRKDLTDFLVEIAVVEGEKR